MLPQGPDRAFVQDLVYTTVRRFRPLRTILGQLVAKWPKGELEALLLVGAAQLLYMPDVPDFAAVNETEVIKITCTSLNPQISADICTYISEIAPSILIRTTKAGSVEPIGHAKVAKSPSSPNVKRTAIIGGLLGMVLASAIVIISHLLDRRIKVADDIKKKFPEMPILAEIPDLYDTKGGVKYE